MIRQAKSIAGQTSTARQTVCVYPGSKANASKLAGTIVSLRHRLVCLDKRRFDPRLKTATRRPKGAKSSQHRRLAATV